MARTLIEIGHNEDAAAIKQALYSDDRNNTIVQLQNYFNALAAGANSAEVRVSTNAVRASGTLTLATHAATNTVTINGTVLTAVASGATSGQYNVGANDTATAVNLALAINALPALQGIALATSSGVVVTVLAGKPGKIGNCITLAISAGGTASVAKLIGGTDGSTDKTYTFGSATVGQG